MAKKRFYHPEKKVEREFYTSKNMLRTLKKNGWIQQTIPTAKPAVPKPVYQEPIQKPKISPKILTVDPGLSIAETKKAMVHWSADDFAAQLEVEVSNRNRKSLVSYIKQQII